MVGPRTPTRAAARPSVVFAERSSRARVKPARRRLPWEFSQPAASLQIASKYDHQAEEDLRNWIEEVTGMSIGTNFQLGLKDGIILCE